MSKIFLVLSSFRLVPFSFIGSVQNFSTVVMDTVAILALCIAAGVSLLLYAKKNYLAIVVTLIVGVLIWYFAKNPTVLESLGSGLGGDIF